MKTCSSMFSTPLWVKTEIFRTVNLPNIGQANNLPKGAVLEATTLINGDGFQPLLLVIYLLGLRLS